MPSPALDSLMSTLRRSNLLSPEQIAVANSLAEESDAVGVAREMIIRGWLTEWQARQLLAGKSKLYLGKYKLLDVLGQGGMGAVLKAESTTLKRTVALKVMATNLHDDGIARARFEREIAFSASLNHPNLVRAIDADQIGDRFFLVMEYFEGDDLKALIRRHGRLPINFACEAIRQAALGLQHASERGIVHRDIKPSNILVATDPKTSRPQIKVLDLGLARVSSQTELVTKGTDDFEKSDASVTRAGQIMGSPDYMSPEQAMSSRDVDIRSDIYGLGVTLFQLIAGELPYSGDNVMEKLLARINTDAPPVTKFRPDVHPALVRIIGRMLHRDPSQRFQTPAEVAAVLEAFVTNPESLQVQATQPERPQIDLPTLTAQEDETLNLFVGVLDTQATTTPSSPVRRRKKDSLKPILISVGTATAILVGVLFALSQGSGPVEKKSKDTTAKKATAEAPAEKTANKSDTPPPESGIGKMAFLPPPDFSRAEVALVDWAQKIAREIRIETIDGEQVIDGSSPLPSSNFDVVGLDLRGLQRITDDEMDRIVSAVMLRSLSLSGCEIRDKQLMKLSQLNHLGALDLGSTLISDKGLEALAGMKSLERLTLRYTSIGDDGLVHLTKAAHLLMLNLEGTNVSRASLESLASMNALSRLNLKHTQFTTTAVDRLRELLPDCQIEY